ncbi:MAG TPA: twin-arginine translocation signal domain-containing protein [Tepidisphaeraceae bacterium]|nr:twin-arginine translocation signal domain-containing protein [Tepidisphaeraceae bacterium]
MQSGSPNELNRRQFLKNSAAAAGAVAAGSLTGCATTAPVIDKRAAVSILYDPSDTIAASQPSQWAIEQLRSSIASRDIPVRICRKMDEVNPADLRINAQAIPNLGPNDSEMASLDVESKAGRSAIIAAGSDPRGLTYALTELAEIAALEPDPMAALAAIKPSTERPANRIRSVMRMFVTNVEDKSWYNDREFWKSYLSMLATNRFNRVNLSLGLGYDAPSGLDDSYFFFAYPFLLNMPGYNVRATNLPDAERDNNLAMLRFISDEAAARGLQFQLGLWTHAYVFTNSPRVNHRIEGLTDQTHGPYCRDALAQVLKECPNITGVTFRIHGESGVPEGSYDFWKTVFTGCVQSGRKVEIDMHAKGMDQQTIDVAMSTDLPINISPKFWAEHCGLPYHQAAIRSTELPTRERGGGAFAQSNGARSFLRYGYGDLLAEDRKYGILHRIWPGTQRLLLWGDPAFAAGYGRAFSFCGSLGGELMEPLSFKGRKGSGLPGGRDGYADKTLRTPGGDFEKYAYTYLLWGRMMYNPDCSPDVWKRHLNKDYGDSAMETGRAMAYAGRILPLFTTAHLPSGSNNNYWPEMYFNMSIVDASRPQPYTDTLNPKTFGGVSPLDPQLFSRAVDYADELLANKVGGKYSPAEVASWLQSLADTASEQLRPAQKKAAKPSPVLRRMLIDVATQTGLGRFFADKLRAGVLYAVYERTGDREVFSEALSAYRSAREHWANISRLTKNIYMQDVSYGSGNFQRGNWSDRLASIDHDIELMSLRGQTPPTPTVKASPETIASIIKAVKAPSARPQAAIKHDVPGSFKRGQAIALQIGITSGEVKEVQLHYRRTHQAQAWQSMAMEGAGTTFSANIPAEYTDSAFPMTYYFELTDSSGRAWIWPGFNPSLSNQPYYLVRQG